MKGGGLTSGAAFLRNAVEDYFREVLEIKKILVNEELDKNLRWTPALRFVMNGHIHVFVEPSEDSPYPAILRMRLANLLHYPEPIQVYIVCPEEIISTGSHRELIKEMKEHGFGLFTVNRDGKAHKEFAAVPIVQVIAHEDFKAHIKDVKYLALRQKLIEAYGDYSNKPTSGVTTLTEIVEGLVNQGAKEAAKKGFINPADANANLAKKLDAMLNSPQCGNAKAAIATVRGYVSNHRNPAHHWPKDKKRARKKYVDCRNSFLSGLEAIIGFREAIRNVGLTGRLPLT